MLCVAFILLQFMHQIHKISLVEHTLKNGIPGSVFRNIGALGKGAINMVSISFVQPLLGKQKEYAREKETTDANRREIREALPEVCKEDSRWVTKHYSGPLAADQTGGSVVRLHMTTFISDYITGPLFSWLTRLGVQSAHGT